MINADNFKIGAITPFTSFHSLFPQEQHSSNSTFHLRSSIFPSLVNHTNNNTTMSFPQSLFIPPPHSSNPYISCYLNRLTPYHSTETALIQPYYVRLKVHLSNPNLFCLVQHLTQLITSSSLIYCPLFPS